MALIVVAIATIAGYRRWAGPRVEVLALARGPLLQTIVTSGRVRPPARVTLAPLVAGRVAEVGATEGQSVAAGALLLRLDDAEARAALAQADGLLDDATAQGKQVRTFSAKDAAEAVKRAKTRVAEATRTHDRITALYESGVASLETLEEAGTALSLAESELRAAQLQQNDIRGTKLVRSEAALRQAEAARAAAAARLGYHQVVAPFNGVVAEKFVELGDILPAASPAFELIRTGETELVIEPDERNLALLAVGQEARASAEAFPDQRFAAVVSYIAPVVDPRRGTIEVRLGVAHPPAYLRPDMTVSVEVIVAERQDVLIAPIDGVRELSSGSPWVLVPEHETARRREVAIGAVGDASVEILSGLEEGDRLIPASADVGPGDRVRAEVGTR